MAGLGAMTPILRTIGLERTFGGLVAVRSVDFLLDRGEIRGIIGPNGAGKTTLVSMISGRIAPTAGRVVFQERDITRLRADERVGLGIAYTFQLVSIFRRLTAYENVAVAAQRRLMRDAASHLHLDHRVITQHVQAALAAVGLQGIAARPAGALPYGHQRLIEVAMALALRPQVLALDEPTQGLSADEIEGLEGLIRRMAGGVTLLVIEHNMRFVLGLSQRITVMDQGSIIAEGTPTEMQRNPTVQRVYLGLTC
jgi:branched-chain amino acid transport system ATP-binding protein